MYSTGVAYLLWLAGGFGALGFHRFYLNKIGTGLLYIFTGGLCGVGSIYDFFTLPMQVRDANLESRYREALEFGVARRGVRGDFRREIAKDFRNDSIERIVLRTAKKNNGIATPSEVALEGDTTLEQAKSHLERLVSKGFAEVRVTKSGSLVYVFPDFSTDATDRNLEDF